jgi:putative restriction endonuclease
MKGFIGVTDNDWFVFLSRQPEIDEVNFWQPGGRSRFRSLSPGEPFFFKLHAPHHFIVGGGFFTHSTILPVSLAWSAFGVKNGASSYAEIRRLIERNRHAPPSQEDYKIGCILLTEPFFFESQDWLPVPPDFSLNIVQGKGYDLSIGHGRELWEQVLGRLASTQPELFEGERKIAEPEQRYGEPVLVLPRLGQGTFRVIVTDAYERRCAITQEKTLPVLEAAHIKPFSDSGPHRIENGILLRSDIHRLFDSGYVTVTPDRHFEVSSRIREEFDNGKTYFAFHGRRIHVPPNPRFRPGSEFLSWHNENIFRS